MKVSKDLMQEAMEAVRLVGELNQLIFNESKTGPKRYFTFREARKELNVDQHTLFMLTTMDQIHSIYFKGRIYYSIESVQEFKERFQD